MRDACAEYRAEQIIYHVQTKLGVELPEDLKHDIRSNVDAVELQRKKENDRHIQENYARRWNELRLMIEQQQPSYASQLLWIMGLLSGGTYVRNIKLKG